MVNSGKKDAVEGKGLTLEKRCYGRERVNSGKNKDAVEGKWLTREKKMLWKGKG
jgi:hypothetical protein